MEILTELGFSSIDINMLILCPFFSAIGGIIHVLILSCDLSKWPACAITDFKLPTDNKKKLDEALAFVANRIMALPRVLLHPPYWILAKVSLSALTGLIIALYFVGIFPPVAPGVIGNPEGVARIFALCIFVGYLAPMLWIAKEKQILTIIESEAFQERLSKIIINNANNGKDRKDNDGTAS